MQKTVLVCDHGSGGQVLLFRLLAEAGYAVTLASDGAEAIAKLEADPPDLMVAHVALPGRGGVELCRYAKALAEPVPVVLLAPGTTPEPIASADAVVGLPLDPVRLLDAVRGLLDAGDAGQGTPSEHVLLVDDDPGIIELLQNLLGGEGYRVSSAASGREALAILEGELPDIMLLDVQMPGMSGFEVLTKIRERWPHLPVVMVTGHGSEEVAADALRLGADDYMAKPLRVRNLSFRLERNLEKARMRAAQARLDQQLRQTTLDLTDRIAQLVDANARLRRLLHRLVTDLRGRIAEGGPAGELVSLLERLRTLAEADDPLSAYDDALQQPGE